MAEYIDREAFIKNQENCYCQNCDRRKGMKNGKMRFVYEIGGVPCRACGIGDVLDAVEDFPTANVKPVVRGKWIVERDFMEDVMNTCSVCGDSFLLIDGTPASNNYNYCPNCGADLREEEEA